MWLLKKREVPYPIRLQLLIEDPDSQGEARFILIGMSSKLRLLTVVYSLPDEDTIRLISARLSTSKEEKYYA